MTKWLSLSIAPDIDHDADVVFACGDGALIGASACIERAEEARRAARFEALPGSWLDVIGEFGEARIVIVSVETAQAPRDRWLAAGGRLVDAMRALRISAVRLPKGEHLGDPSAIKWLFLGALLHGYRLHQERAAVEGAFRPTSLVITGDDQAAADEAIRVATAINRARAWTEQPANLLTPAVFAQEAASALERYGVTVTTLGAAELEQIGMGGLLAVGRSSEHEPKLVVAEWRGASERTGWDAALVGKGVTFDGGGLNIKTRPIIEKMKFDMGGAAAVLGALELAASRKAPVNVVAIVPMAENVIDGRAMRPGDVIRMMSGLTVEIGNTDAEGRLLLADGVTYAINHYQPRNVVDVATLTGMITGVLHEEYAGLYASDDGLADALLHAGNATSELLWRMPLVATQDYLVESSVADLANVGASGFLGLGYGSPAAGAKFIERFARGTAWAHIDIAGTAWATRRTPRSQPGATGYGVALLDAWLDGLGHRHAD
ncbi:leucyl aminopeptidase [Sphingomonas palmae]|uniref:Leucyl aminopeptidase n=1 Tax=Sphingomonas palmae TaxID=1855283 RepID=A0A1H7M5F3_9SPHN|nr:leucyl aminopeptidase family protein [Sphingomonas palmae]SEL06339.1 leucyl aminopeptidase [Sphingomonas palmae]